MQVYADAYLMDESSRSEYLAYATDLYEQVQSPLKNRVRLRPIGFHT
jgi:hypothetical protein